MTEQQETSEEDDVPFTPEDVMEMIMEMLEDTDTDECLSEIETSLDEEDE